MLSPSTAVAMAVAHDVSPIARNLGFCIRSQVTDAVWRRVIEPTPWARDHYQDESGRAWRVLMAARGAICRGLNLPETEFRAQVVDDSSGPRAHELVAHFAPAGPGRTTMTVMFPEER